MFDIVAYLTPSNSTKLVMVGSHTSGGGVPVTDPALHVVQANVEDSENCPAAHGVQNVAPVKSSVSVMNPAVQNSHGAVEAALKCPEGHPVQVMAPVPSRVSVVTSVVNYVRTKSQF